MNCGDIVNVILICVFYNDETGAHNIGSAVPKWNSSQNCRKDNITNSKNDACCH